MCPLNEDERTAALAAVPLWCYDIERRALFRRLDFPDFAAALGAMVTIGVHAEKADHHPEWSNVYNRLDIWLTTHDAGGVTVRDFELAATIDRLCPTPDG